MRVRIWGVVVLLGLCGVLSAAPLAEIRSWQFHVMKIDYIKSALDRAHDYDINTVVYSHGIVSEVSQLYKGDERAGQLRLLASEAHKRGLRVWIWVHELESDVPRKFMEGRAVNLDSDGFWDWLRGKYEKLFTDFPAFDGIMLTFQETKYKIFSEGDVKSKLSMPERFTKMINTIDDACAKYKKDFVVRSFLYEPTELQWFAEGIKKVHKRVMLQSKCVPHDWEPYYPHNPMIGKFPDRKLIVEFDCSSEFTGRNNVPYTQPEYFEYRWRYDLSQPGVVGYNARLDHGGYDALFTPNEINIYTMSRLTEDKNVTAQQIWDEWTTKHYGKAAAGDVEKALKLTFDALNKSFFVLEFWITNHSQLPSYGYANGHISSRTIAKWKPGEARYGELEKRLNKPDVELLEEILAEKDQAIALTDEALGYLAKAHDKLKGEDYDDLYRRLNLLRRTATVWKLQAEAFFGYKILADGKGVPGLKQRVERAIKGLYEQAQVSDKAGWAGPPCGGDEIRSVAKELKDKLGKL